MTSSAIAKLFEERGFEVNKRDILLSDGIKELGEYTVSIRLHPEVIAKIKLSVSSEKE